MRKTDGSAVGFRHIKDKNIKIPLNFDCVFHCDFCSALNETAPLNFSGYFIALLSKVIPRGGYRCGQVS